MLKNSSHNGKLALKLKDRIYIGIAICLFVTMVVYALYVGMHHRGHSSSDAPTDNHQVQTLSWPWGYRLVA